MARLDDLVDQVADLAVQVQLRAAVAELKARKRFGLVFEEHIPETSSLFGLPIAPGATVQLRRENGAVYRVATVRDGMAQIDPIDTGERRAVPTGDLLVVKRFTEPIFPTLLPLGEVRRADGHRPAHAVINGENYHALQLLTYLCEGQVDCIYIDPPYNSGTRDWRYNNRYVDSNDRWRHSKWLSFMDKRLRLAKRLLKPDGVLIVTVDENEVHHLGLLLEEIFRDPDYLRYTITIVYNPKGTGKANFGRVDEQAYFVVPNIGYDVINPKPAATSDDSAAGGMEELEKLACELAELSDVGLSILIGEDSPLDPSLRAALERATKAGQGPTEQLDISELAVDSQQGVDVDAHGDGDAALRDQILSHRRPEAYEDLFLRRRGQESSHRDSRPNQFYAILVDEAERKVVGLGPPLGKDESYAVTHQGDALTVYPINKDGEERVWRYTRETMQRYINDGVIVVGQHHPADPQPYTLNHRRLRGEFRRLKTVWWDKSHDAGTHGTSLLDHFLGKRQLFPFPKSIYAVRDALAAVVRNRPNALILDFFAGSGTTLHATCLLNAEDGGHRRSILVTNNEVGDKVAAELNGNGLWRGDPEYEAHGIFEAVTRPRCEAAVTGLRPDGTPISGRYRNGRAYAAGFEERVAFFELGYLDADELDLNGGGNALQPAQWLGAGAVGEWASDMAEPWVMPDGAGYAILVKTTRFRHFLRALADRPNVRMVYLVTDSPEAFAEMCAAMPVGMRVTMLYRDYRQFFSRTTAAR